MKVYEMKPNEIGWAVEVPDRDAIIITLTKENRVLIVSKSNKELVVSEVELQSIKKKPDTVKDEARNHMKPGAPKKNVSSFEHRKPLKYLPVREDPVLGKTLNTSIALTVYKHYGVRLWNNPSAEIVSQVLSSQEAKKDYSWVNEIICKGLNKYNITYSKTKSDAYVMFLKGIHVLSTKREFSKKVMYVVNTKAISTT
jgi:hypothetical protein